MWKDKLILLFIEIQCPLLLVHCTEPKIDDNWVVTMHISQHNIL
jgi:hypothetical protein